MSNTPQAKLPWEQAYLDEMARRVKSVGRNAIAIGAEMDPATIHRRINEKKMTFTAATKLVDALNEINPRHPLPPPFIGVIDARHYQLCGLATRLAQLEEKHPIEVREAVEDLLDAIHKIEQDDLIGDALPKLKSPK